MFNKIGTRSLETKRKLNVSDTLPTFEIQLQNEIKNTRVIPGELFINS